jgi:hypothetical protein
MTSSSLLQSLYLLLPNPQQTLCIILVHMLTLLTKQSERQVAHRYEI